jgi:uncharacterized protein (TIGR00255 family)
MEESVRGMTGFGSAEHGGFRVEVKSLNHRYLDISVKLPLALVSQEMAIREAVKGRFSRGRIDVYVSVVGAGRPVFKIDVERGGEVLHAVETLRNELALSGEIEIETLLHWKDLLIREETSYDTAPLADALEEALAGAAAMREKEGEALREELRGRSARFGALTEEVAGLLPAVREAAVERYRTRIAELLAATPADEGKAIQEAAALADRLDISEEVSRTRHHIAHLGEMLAEGGPIGRKLDFLFQEFIRETNTMASKIEDHRILRLAIEMKSEIEKAREQAQNVE